MVESKTTMQELAAARIGLVDGIEVDARSMPWVPLPSKAAPPRASYHLTPLICDERVIGQLIETLLASAGLSIAEAARRIGCSPNTISEYINARRTRPSLLWFLKIVALCGARASLEFAPSPRS